MRKSKILSSVLVIAFFISFISVNPDNGHFIQLGSEAWATPIISTVVNQAYDTSGNGGRKLVRLSNGWLVCAAYDSSGTWKVNLYVSKDNGGTWNVLCYVGSVNTTYAITSYNTDVYVLFLMNSNAQNACVKINALTATNIDMNSSKVIVDTQSGFGSGCSITTDSSGNLYAAWCSKNSTYPNSFNIRHAKSTNGGTTWTKVDGTAGIDQITTANTSATNSINPCVVVLANGRPIIAYQTYNGTYYYIESYRYNGSSWLYTEIQIATTYIQSNPCAVVSPDGTINVVWEGKDSIESSHKNICFSKSIDSGTSWSARTKLTTGNDYDMNHGSIISDKNNNLYVVYHSYPTPTSIKMIKYSGGLWGSIIQIALGTTNILYPQTCANYTNFNDPLIIYQDNQIGAIRYYGNALPPVAPPNLAFIQPSQNVALFPNLETP